jgi:uncharacterized protein DUF5330
MFFLLRMTFWLGLVCVLLPGSSGDAPAAKIDAANAVTAAGAAVSDMRGFCERQPQACEVGGQVAVAIGHKAEAGARTLYEFVSTKLNEKSEQTADKGTLTPADIAPAWRAPAVPLPPRREARTARPSA